MPVNFGGLEISTPKRDRPRGGGSGVFAGAAAGDRSTKNLLPNPSYPFAFSSQPRPSSSQNYQQQPKQNQTDKFRSKKDNKTNNRNPFFQAKKDKCLEDQLEEPTAEQQRHFERVMLENFIDCSNPKELYCDVCFKEFEPNIPHRLFNCHCERRPLITRYMKLTLCPLPNPQRVEMITNYFRQFSMGLPLYDRQNRKQGKQPMVDDIKRNR